ncbi:exonuclease V-like [Teratosphaeria destructans]|uniref:Exonuclease V-like n=1 Tax=Teratosphaeria destructans TaxID=418781 RepID=A0A9W7T2L8_9PEZI|nr:exonuclease V-like [Teratosphaeria destructans]
MALTDPHPRCLFFDVFGTCVDWRKTITQALWDEARNALNSPASSLASRIRIKASDMTFEEWGEVAQEWRNSYLKFTRALAADPAQPYKTVDQHHLDSLREIMTERGVLFPRIDDTPSNLVHDGSLWDEQQLQDLTMMWHKLEPWPDTCRGIRELNRLFWTCTLTNGNLDLITDMAKHGNMEFTHIFSAEMFQSYKPNPRVYLGAASKLGLQPNECVMVAAHLDDLKAAKSNGFRTVYVERPREERHQSWIESGEAKQWVDVWVTMSDEGFVSMAEKLGVQILRQRQRSLSGPAVGMVGAKISTIACGDSDYGSDLDEATVDQILSQASQQPGTAPPVIEKPEILDDHGDGRPLARLARIRDDLTEIIAQLNRAQQSIDGSQRRVERETPVAINYDEANKGAFSPNRAADEETQQKADTEPAAEPIPRIEKKATLTPIQRFRTQPKKPLSVTDLISPAWCELQYWYSLTKYGKVKRTAAMKQGSKVHKKLEEQVHKEVPVDVQTKEDRFALRIWNIIQGLRTLRRTGMTRELEVWGVVHGEVVNGIVDQITTECPGDDAEADMLQTDEQASSIAGKKGSKGKTALAHDQRTLTDYMTSPQTSATVLEQQAGNSYGFLGTLHDKPKTLYMVDVKTRQSKSLPSSGSQTRPVHYQLMMYHRLFSTLAANGVDALHIFARYGVDPNATFSDVFIASMSTFDTAFEHENPTDPWDENDLQPRDSVTEILSHNTLLTLWSLMISEFSKSIPLPTSLHTPSISNLLTAEYREAKVGGLIGKRFFVFDAEVLDAYVKDEMRWWQGERETKGVDIEEAFKCRICEFAEGCEWRRSKVEEGLSRSRVKREGEG